MFEGLVASKALVRELKDCGLAFGVEMEASKWWDEGS